MKLSKLLLIALVVGVVASFATPIFAQSWGGGSEGVFTEVQSKLTDAFKNTKIIFYVLGAFALIGVAFLAVSGKVHWKWFLGLLAALAVVAVAGGIVSYVTDVEGGAIALNDTLNG